MPRSFSFLVATLLLVTGTTGLSVAQGISCGPGVGWDKASGDSILFINATCMKSMALGPVSAGAHLGYGFGSYDVSEFASVDGSYSAIRVSAIFAYPIEISPDGPIGAHVFAAPGILSWSEDCDFSDCSDTELIVDLGGGATYNDQFSAEIYAIAGGSMDFGARLRAMFPIN